MTDSQVVLKKKKDGQSFVVKICSILPEQFWTGSKSKVTSYIYIYTVYTGINIHYLTFPKPNIQYVYSIFGLCKQKGIQAGIWRICKQRMVQSIIYTRNILSNIVFNSICFNQFYLCAPVLNILTFVFFCLWTELLYSK